MWLDFSSLELAAGDSITQTYVIDGLYSLVVTIDDISFSGTLYNNVDLADQRLVGYKSGNYGGDGLVKLYNIGVPNNGEEIHERYQNTLYNALSFKHAGSNKCNGEEAIGNFRIRAYAYLNGSTDPKDVGLVFASAETDEPIPYNDITCDEFSKGVTNGSPWQVLETGFYDPDGYQRVIIDDNGQTASTACGFNGFDWAIGNSIILYTKKLTTTLVNPLNVNMQFSGGGNTATAIGFLLTSVDKGDAPESYGLAENLFFSTVLGGTPPADGAYFISTEGEYGGPNVVETGMLGYSNVPRLGDIAGDPDDYSSISNSSANTDDYDGIADEDAIAQPIFVTTRDTAFSIQFNATNIPGYDAYVNAWFDANKNGTFDPAEFKK